MTQGPNDDGPLWGIVPNPDDANLPPIVFRRADNSNKNSKSPMRYFSLGFDARQEAIDLAVSRIETSPVLSLEKIDEIMRTLDAIKGQQELKTIVRQIVENLQIQKIRAMAGIKPKLPTLHMVFCGKPGTGKTTAARLVAKILHDCGYSENNTFIEAGRADLVAEYVGQTEKKTKKVLQSAKGGVLFIDEAYSLNEFDTRDYGYEVINFLVTEMMKPDLRTTIICAGYEDEMKAFLASNPGFRSRFSHVIHFTSLDLDGYMSVLDEAVEEAEYKLTPEARRKFEYILREHIREGHLADGHVRTLKKMLDQAIARHASRILSLKKPQLRHFSTLEAEDIPGKAPEIAEDRESDGGNVVPFRR